MQERVKEYDWLRGISCISIVILHISAMYLQTDFSSLIQKVDYMTASFWRVLSDFAVPSFVMLSGAFIIKDENLNYNVFYKKTIYKIIFPTLVFSIIYVLMHYAEIILAGILNINADIGRTNIWSPIINWFKGSPHVTMWYMYMIIPLYLITPVIVIIKKSISSKAYTRLAIFMMFYGVAVSMSCSLSWILQFVEWLGYFMLGGVIRKGGQTLRHRYRDWNWQLIGGSLIAVAYFILIVYWYVFTYRSGQLAVPGSFSSIVIIATLLQFMGISVLSIRIQNNLIEGISKYSFEVYLIHPIFCEVFAQLCGRILKRFPPAWFVPVYALFITIICVGIAAAMIHLKRRMCVARILWEK